MSEAAGHVADGLELPLHQGFLKGDALLQPSLGSCEIKEHPHDDDAHGDQGYQAGLSTPSREGGSFVDRYSNDQRKIVQPGITDNRRSSGDSILDAIDAARGSRKLGCKETQSLQLLSVKLRLRGSAGDQRAVGMEESDRVVFAELELSVEALEEERFDCRDDDARSVDRIVKRPHDRDEPTPDGATEKRTADKAGIRRRFDRRLEIRPIGETDTRRDRIISIMNNEAVRGYDKECADVIEAVVEHPEEGSKLTVVLRDLFLFQSSANNLKCQICGFEGGQRLLM